jgi:tetratricopeptide (TPR) repeat protein
MIDPRSHHRHRIFILGLACLLGAAVAAGAQEPLSKAKALYDSANYEEALKLLAPVDVPEAQQYKALCMLALGRAQEATGAVESLVKTAPTFEPSPDEVPPRFVTLVTEAKRKLLPAIARRTFNEARDEFRTGDRQEAMKKFDFVLALTASAPFKDSPDAEDLRTLASGFIELAKASAAAPPRPDPKTAAAEPKVIEEPPAQAPEVIQPVAIRQPIPPIPSGISGLGSPTASVRVQIGADGKVVGATMQQASHPLYDRMVLQAARDWIYAPATLNGRAVPSEKIVTIQLR